MQFVEQLDFEWSEEGFLGRLRTGSFVPTDAARFLSLLKDIRIPDGALVPKRALSLLWYLPSFLMWQRDRVAARGGDVVAFDRFITDVHSVLEDVLGVP